MARQNLRNSSDILRLLNKVTKELLDDNMEESRARAIIYACSTAGQIIKNIELENRLEVLEDNSEQKGA